MKDEADRFASLTPLKPELCCYLTDTRISRLSDIAEGAVLVADVSVDRIASSDCA
jgi:hypothetical protein